ncbi:Coronin-7, partial [Entomortierella beljakovae]
MSSILSYTTSRSRSGSISASSAHGSIYSANGNISPPPMPPIPQSIATHPSYIPERYVKHATLINNCYPSRPDEKGPKSSELSYLVFYTTSKPEKLNKVLSFIERKTIRDHRKKRISDVHCSLEIIKELLSANKAHMNMLSKNIVSTLDPLLADITDYDLVRHCQVVFSSFCSAHDGSTLGVDEELRTLYFRIMSRFAHIACLKGDENCGYRLVGLKALHSVILSDAFHVGNFQSHVGFVVPCIFGCLIDAKDDIQLALDTYSQTGAPASIYTTTFSEKEVTNTDTLVEALKCLDSLFNSHNGAYVKHALEPSLAFLEKHDCWWPSKFIIDIIRVMLNSMLPHLRYMMVSEILSPIEKADSTTPDILQRLQKKVTLISSLDAIFSSPLSLIGMPVLEVLNSLLSFLMKSLSNSVNLNKEGDSSPVYALETLIQEDLVRCIGGLVKHIYYSNQVSHLVSTIATKLSLQLNATPKPLTIENVPTVEYRKALLRCLTAIIKTSKDKTRQGANYHQSDVSSELLTPCLGLLLDDNAGVRTSFAQALITFLATDEEKNGHMSNSTLNSDLNFRSALHQTLHCYARIPAATPTDMSAIYGILRALFTRFEDDELLRVFPVLFSLQDWCLQEESDIQAHEALTQLAQKRALATVIVIFFQKAVARYKMEEPREYLDNIQSSRERESQWHSVYYENEECLTRITNQQWEAPSEPYSPVLTHPLARDHLITLLTTSSDRFRTGADGFNVIYDPSAVVIPQASREPGSMVFASSLGNKSRSGILRTKSDRFSEGRIRISRHMEDWALPSLPASSGPSSVLTSLEDSTEPSAAASTQISCQGSFIGDQSNEFGNLSQRSIGVDHLKAALSATHLADDASISVVGSETRSASPGSRHFYLQSGLRLKNQPLDIGSSSASITSNPISSRPDLADLLNNIQVTAPARSVGILPVGSVGRVGQNTHVLGAHSSGVSDWEFSPFDPNQLFTGSENGEVKVWQISSDENGLAQTQLLSIIVTGTGKTIETIIIAIASQNVVQIWDASNKEQGSTLSTPSYTLSHPNAVSSISWKSDGTLLATTCKDTKIRVFNPRQQDTPIQIGQGHAGIRSSRIVWLGEKDLLFTLGFNKMRERESALWNANDLNKPLEMKQMDSSSGLMLPLFDEDTSMLFIFSRGESTIRWVEIAESSPYLSEGPPFAVPGPVAGAALAPKQILNVMQTEVDRIIALSNNMIWPLSVSIPRRSYLDYHSDLYPETKTTTPGLKASEWLNGENNPVPRMSLDPGMAGKSQWQQQGFSTISSSKANTTSNPKPVSIAPSPTVAAATQPIQKVNAPVASVPAVVSQPIAPSVNTPTKENIPEKPSTPPSVPVASSTETSVSPRNVTPPPSSASRVTPSSSPAAVRIATQRSSRFRFLTFKPYHVSEHFESISGLSINAAPECNLIEINPKFIALPLQGPGGRIGILKTSEPGRVGNKLPSLVCSSDLTSFKFDPFDPNLLVTSSDDSKIKGWIIPEEGIDKENDATKPDWTLTAPTMDKITLILFHPLAKDVLLSASSDRGNSKIRIWDLKAQKEVVTMTGHKDVIFSCAFNHQGTKVVSVCKDKKIRVWDALTGELLQEGSGHDSLRASRVLWLGESNLVASVGFGRGSQREILLFDSTNLASGPVDKKLMDNSPGVLVPHYDPDTSVLGISARGDRVMKHFEVILEPKEDGGSRFVDVANLEQGTLQQDVAYLPKRYCKVKEVELAKMYRLTYNSVEVIGVSVPRNKKEYFQDDLYPDTTDVESRVMTASEFFSGNNSNAKPKKISMCPPGMES